MMLLSAGRWWNLGPHRLVDLFLGKDSSPLFLARKREDIKPWGSGQSLSAVEHLPAFGWIFAGAGDAAVHEAGQALALAGARACQGSLCHHEEVTQALAQLGVGRLTGRVLRACIQSDCKGGFLPR